MSQTVLREDKPTCFGRVDDPGKGQEGWNPNVAACAGGADPAYTNEKTGSHVRERCEFFNQCGSTASAKKFELMRQSLIPATSLVKQPPVVGPSVNQVAPQAKVMESLQKQQQAPLMQQQQAQYNAMMQQMAQMQRMGMPVQQQQMPQMMPMGYQQMMPVNYQMPAYLTAPEHLEPGGFWKAMARTVFRSVGKSVGHSVAHMFDSIPFSATRPPGK